MRGGKSLSNVKVLVVHCLTNKSYIVRQTPFGKEDLADEDRLDDFRELTTPADRVAVTTSRHLTDKTSRVELRPGTLWMFQDSEVCAQCDTLPSSFRSMAEMEGYQG